MFRKLGTISVRLDHRLHARTLSVQAATYESAVRQPGGTESRMRMKNENRDVSPSIRCLQMRLQASTLSESQQGRAKDYRLLCTQRQTNLQSNQREVPAASMKEDFTTASDFEQALVTFDWSLFVYHGRQIRLGTRCDASERIGQDPGQDARIVVWICKASLRVSICEGYA